MSPADRSEIETDVLPVPKLHLPEDVEASARKGRRLEWWTIAYLVSAVVLLYLVLGSSQAMRAAWFEDLLSLVPPIGFLIASRVDDRAPNTRFPFGFHRATSIAHLASALALFGMGGYLAYDAARSLLSGHHPTIGTVTLFGEAIWLGWLMLPALLWTGIPAVFLGRAKQPLAKEIHNKILYADADMNEADWKTAAAAMVGVIGVGLGFWWADAAAAGLVGLDIFKDGIVNIRSSISDLIDQVPTKVDHSGPDPLIGEVVRNLEALPWVRSAAVQLREQGKIMTGDALVEIADLDAISAEELSERLREARRVGEETHWRVLLLSVTLRSVGAKED